MNTLEPFNVAHRIFVRLMLIHLYNKNNRTDKLFKIFNVLKIGQLYDKLTM